MKLQQHFSLAIKLDRHFICTEIMPIFMFAMKLRHHLSLLWNCVNSCFALKHHHYFVYWSKFALVFFNEAFSTWSHVNISFTVKPRQHSSLPWSHVNTLFALKPCQYSSLPWHRINTSSALEDVRRMLPRLWHCMNMPLEERWCNTNFRC